jgi:hypothetical protein
MTLLSVRVLQNGLLLSDFRTKFWFNDFGLIRPCLLHPRLKTSVQKDIYTLYKYVLIYRHQKEIGLIL